MGLEKIFKTKNQGGQSFSTQEQVEELTLYTPNIHFLIWIENSIERQKDTTQ